MSTLKGLTFAAYTRQDKLTIDVQRRNKLVVHLQEQLAMAEAQAKGETYIVKKRKWVSGQDGGKVVVEVNKRLKQWWQVQPNGSVLLTIRYSARPLEFEKGKAAILVNNRGELPEVLSKVISAVNAGEFDALMASATKHRLLPRRNVA